MWCVAMCCGRVLGVAMCYLYSIHVLLCVAIQYSYVAMCCHAVFMCCYVLPCSGLLETGQCLSHSLNHLITVCRWTCPPRTPIPPLPSHLPPNLWAPRPSGGRHTRTPPWSQKRGRPPQTRQYYGRDRNSPIGGARDEQRPH